MDENENIPGRHRFGNRGPSELFPVRTMLVIYVLALGLVCWLGRAP